jgi:hypothetical protein
MHACVRFLPFVVMSALLGCAELQSAADPPGAAAAPTPIDAKALQVLYATPHREDGMVLHGSHQGAEWTKWAKPNGHMELLAGHGLFADTGKYTLRGNRICTAWGHIDAGKEGCETLVLVGTDEYVTYGSTGSEGSRFKVRP